MFFELNRSRDLFYYSRAALCSTAILAQAFFFFYRQLLQQLGLWNTRRRLSLHYVLAIFSCLITSIFRTANPADLCHFFHPPTPPYATNVVIPVRLLADEQQNQQPTTSWSSFSRKRKKKLNRTSQCPRGTFTTGKPSKRKSRTPRHAVRVPICFSPNTLFPSPRYNNCAV